MPAPACSAPPGLALRESRTHSVQYGSHLPSRSMRGTPSASTTVTCSGVQGAERHRVVHDMRSEAAASGCKRRCECWHGSHAGGQDAPPAGPRAAQRRWRCGSPRCTRSLRALCCCGVMHSATAAAEGAGVQAAPAPSPRSAPPAARPPSGKVRGRRMFSLMKELTSHSTPAGAGTCQEGRRGCQAGVPAAWRHRSLPGSK